MSCNSLNQYPLKTKTLSKVRIELKFISLNKGIHKKLTSNIIPNCKQTKCFKDVYSVLFYYHHF